jgi:hypothetical protein
LTSSLVYGVLINDHFFFFEKIIMRETCNASDFPIFVFECTLRCGVFFLSHEHEITKPVQYNKIKRKKKWSVFFYRNDYEVYNISFGVAFLRADTATILTQIKSKNSIHFVL